MWIYDLLWFWLIILVAFFAWNHWQVLNYSIWTVEFTMDSTSHEILSDFDYSGEKKIGYKEKGMLLIVFFSLRIFILTNYDILSYGHPLLWILL